MTVSTNRPLACVILAAGQGTRMKSTMPKVMHAIANKPMVSHVVTACESLSPEKIVVVVAPGMESVEKSVSPHPCVIQKTAQGTGDAVKAALPALQGFAGDVVVLYGDTPFVSAEAIGKMREQRATSGAAIVVAGFAPQDPAQYGRLILEGPQDLRAIVEYNDATPDQRAIGLCNGGFMLFDGTALPGLLNALSNDNAKKEYYLTDCVHLARGQGAKCSVVMLDEIEVLGINNRQQLAEAEKLFQSRFRAKAMANGVTLIDPDTVFFSADTKLGRDIVIEPNVFIGPKVSLADGVRIRAFSHLEGATVQEGATIGPFARLRPGAFIGVEARVGNFVEIKNARLETGAKANHLTYIGDAEIGAGANIGAGTITCNYDGYFKYKTVIGPGAFIGSNTALVAPVTVGEGAIIGAGSTITRDVPAQALGVTRASLSLFEGWAAKFRAKKQAEKDRK